MSEHVLSTSQTTNRGRDTMLTRICTMPQSDRVRVYERETDRSDGYRYGAGELVVFVDGREAVVISRDRKLMYQARNWPNPEPLVFGADGLPASWPIKYSEPCYTIQFLDSGRTRSRVTNGQLTPLSL